MKPTLPLLFLLSWLPIAAAEPRALEAHAPPASLLSLETASLAVPSLAPAVVQTVEFSLTDSLSPDAIETTFRPDALQRPAWEHWLTEIRRTTWRFDDPLPVVARRSAVPEAPATIIVGLGLLGFVAFQLSRRLVPH